MTTDPLDPEKLIKLAPTRVVVVGAGIAGLTAAHELVERGFEVEVVEALTDLEGRPAIGGMARTQYAEAPSFVAREGAPFVELHEARFLRFVFEPDPRPGVPSISDPNWLPIRDYFKNRPAPHNGAGSAAAQTPPSWSGLVLSGPTAKVDAVFPKICQELGFSQTDAPIRRVYDERCDTMLFMDGAHVPAEHGFRFFPSFYHHMFDTMKRIPMRALSLLKVTLPSGEDETVGIAVSDARESIFDNLVAANEFHFAVEEGHSWSLRRQRPTSIEEMRTTLRHLLDDMGYDPTEGAKLTARLLQYLLTSRARRTTELERITWLDYVEIERFTGRLAKHLRSAPQILAAMNAEKGEARTIGSIAMQLLLDQLRDHEFVDALLNGPTSETFLEPWRAYLEDQGVTFTRATLTGFTGVVPRAKSGDWPYVRPVFEVPPVAHNRRRSPPCDSDADVGSGSVAPADYYVLTIPVDKMQALFEGNHPYRTEESTSTTPPRLSRRKLLKASKLWCKIRSESSSRHAAHRCQDDFARYLSFQCDGENLDDGSLRHMIGVQFYFESDVRWIRGHTMLSDSAWGIALVSQPQFWGTKARASEGYIGVVSTAFSHMDVPGPLYNKAAKDCTRAEIAAEVWHQIERTIKDPIKQKPSLFYVDSGLSFDDPTKPFSTNKTRYLVNNAGDWARRPGRRLGDDYVYDVQVGNVVFAGVFMRTHTRLTSMEAANESGRRATNAILDATKSPARRCDIFDMETREWADGRAARELDQRLFERGGGHPLSGMVMDLATDSIPWKLLNLLRGEP